jgi:hypothetical protein
MSGIVPFLLHSPVRMDGMLISCLQDTSRPPYQKMWVKLSPRGEGGVRVRQCDEERLRCLECHTLI